MHNSNYVKRGAVSSKYMESAKFSNVEDPIQIQPLYSPIYILSLYPCRVATFVSFFFLTRNRNFIATPKEKYKIILKGQGVPNRNP